MRCRLRASQSLYSRAAPFSHDDINPGGRRYEKTETKVNRGRGEEGEADYCGIVTVSGYRVALGSESSAIMMNRIDHRSDNARDEGRPGRPRASFSLVGRMSAKVSPVFRAR